MATTLLLILFVIVVGTMFAQARGRRVRLMRLRAIAGRFAPLALYVLPAAFAVQACIAYAITRQDVAAHPWLAQLPIPFKWYGRPWLSAPLQLLQVTAVALQSAALVAIAFGRVSHRQRTIVAAVLGCIAVGAPTLMTSDPYYYAVAGVRGLGIYRSDPHDVLPFAFLEEHLFLRGSLYGPLWVLSNSLVTALGTTLLAKLVLLRLTGAALVFACAAALRRAEFGNPVQTAFLVNPMIWWYFVLNAHNDVWPVLLVLCAAGCVRAGRRTAAAALIGAAGCFKLPFVLVGSVIFAACRSLSDRLRYGALALAICATVSAVLGGKEYLAELLGYSSHPMGHASFEAALPIVGGSALLAIALAFVRRRFFPPAAWFMAALTPLPYPWYFIWAVPYAAAARRGFLKVLLLLPFAGLFLDSLADPFVPAAIAAVFTAAAIVAARPGDGRGLREVQTRGA